MDSRRDTIKNKIRVVVIADCDYEDKPLGGVVSLLNNMLQVCPNSTVDFHLVGVSFNSEECEGSWQKKTIRGKEYRWFPVCVFKKAKENIKIPIRYRLVAGIRRYGEEIGFSSFDAAYVHNPEVVIALPESDFPFVVHVHGDPLIAIERSRFSLLRHSPFINIYNRIIQNAFDRASGIIWAARACRTAYYQKLRVESVPAWDKKSRVIYSSVDPLMFEVTEESNFEVSSCSKGIVTVSRLSDVKHIDFLINVYHELRKNRSDITFYIAGEGECRAALEEQVHTLRCPDVHFMGNLNKVELSKMLDRMSVFVFASESEAMSLVVLESLSRGVPVVTTRVGDLSEAVNDTTGAIVSAREIAPFAQAVNRCLDRGKKAYRDACITTAKEYSAERMRLSIEEFIRECIR